jgi:hypothetical protein
MINSEVGFTTLSARLHKQPPYYEKFFKFDFAILQLLVCFDAAYQKPKGFPEALPVADA